MGGEKVLESAGVARVGGSPVPLQHAMLARDTVREFVPHCSVLTSDDYLLCAAGDVPAPWVPGVDGCAEFFGVGGGAFTVRVRDALQLVAVTVGEA